MAGKTTEENWEGVSEGARTVIQFNEIGDTFIGFYEGKEVVEDPNENEDGTHDSWEQYNFTGVFPSEVEGEKAAVNAGFDLRRALDQIEPNRYLVRMALVKLVPVKGQPSPMKSFRVDKRLP